MIDVIGEELRRLIAFTGLKIINIEVNDYDMIIYLKLGRKRFKLLVSNSEMILYDSKGIEVCKVKPKQLDYPNVKQPTTIIYPYTTVTTGNTSTTWYPSSSVGNWSYTSNTDGVAV